MLDMPPLNGPNTRYWPIHTSDKETGAVGKVTSAVYSPRLQKNIALAMVAIEHTEIGTELEVRVFDAMVPATVVAIPFFDPQKKVAST